MRGKYDVLWKGLLERVFDDFLRFVFPDADNRFDMQRGFTYLDKELAELLPHPEEASDTKFVDKLVKVYTRNGKEKYLLVHVEMQGRYDEKFTARMFKYFYRAYDKYDRPVLPVAIFAGGGGNRMGNQFCLKEDGMQLIYQFNTMDIKDFTDAELNANNNPFAGAFLAARGLSISGGRRDERLLKKKIELAKNLYGKGFAKEKIEGLLSFIQNYVLFEQPEYNRIFKEEVDVITGKSNTMDILEQVAEIRAELSAKKAKVETKQTIVLNLLRETKFSESKIASIADLPVEAVRKMKKTLR